MRIVPSLVCRAVCCCLTALSLVGRAQLPEETPTPPPADIRVTPVTRAVAKVLPTVVNISTERVINQRYHRYGTVDPFQEFFNQYFGPHERHYRTSSLGSGVIVDAAGLVVTNDHVIQRASRIIVTLADGANLEATPIATDEKNDLALLQLVREAGSPVLQAIDFAKPDDLILGEQVITVGNPFGLGHSVAAGVLSAVGRKAVIDGEVLFDDILQTDAAINPGNSGGPLINANARLIGVNLAIRRDAEGIGFAIPLKRIEDVLAHWMVPERFSHASIGLVPGSRLLEGGKCEAIVGAVRDDSPAAKAGLKAGDVILRVDGAEVTQAIQVSRILWRKEAGHMLNLELGDGRKLTIELLPLPRLSGPELARAKFQAELQELTPRLALALRLPYSRGLVVGDIVADGVLGRRGVQKGDVIIQVGEVPISDFADLVVAFEHLHEGDVVQLTIDRTFERAGRYILQRYVVDIPFRL